MARRSKTTPKKIKTFLEELKLDGNVTRACLASGLDRDKAYRLRNKGGKFAEDWETAVEQGDQALLDEMRRRAYRGVSAPIMYQGRLVGFKKEYSDNLLMFAIKAKHPEYRDQFKMGISGENFSLNVNIGPGDDDGDA